MSEAKQVRNNSGQFGSSPMSVHDRIMTNVAVVEDCWEWLGCRTADGYGRFFLDGMDTTAHRASYKEFVGAIPPGLEIDHVCGNRGCVKPSHLRAVTHRENVLRGNTIVSSCASKTHCPAGHAYDLSNTRVNRDGSRGCKSCQALRSKLSNAKQGAK